MTASTTEMDAITEEVAAVPAHHGRARRRRVFPRGWRDVASACQALFWLLLCAVLAGLLLRMGRLG